MNLAFDSRPVRDAHGVGRYTRCLLEALRETAGADAEIVETSRPRTADVFHSPWMNGALLHSPCPMVVTVHDLTALKRRSELLSTSVRPRMRALAVQRAMRVIVPTEALAHDALDRLGVEREQIDVIHEAPAACMYPRERGEVEDVRARFALPERYLLWVGGLQHPDPAKHVAKLAATPREMPLVLVGSTSPWAHELPNVILTGQVPDDDLAALYTGAHALVVASHDEGFGLPAVEALACGTPVVACEVPALREVLAGRITFVPAGDLRSLIEAAEAAERPAPRPPTWSWQDAARATWGVYERARVQASQPRALGRLLRGRPDTPRSRPAGPGQALSGQ
ncbi:MAG TPA: glycosyltransferase [Solirubrobacteraceae bacterium]|nr:glycosyltransferase [Solirubrobacteraceae bacterium]